MQINLNLTSKRPNGKKVSRFVTFINPDASNEDLQTFAFAYMALSENTLSKVQKVKKKNLRDYYVLGTEGGDWLEVGNECTVVSGAGNDTLVFGAGNDTMIIGADITATIRDFSNDDCISLASAVDSATFDGGVLTLGNNVITLENVSDIDAFSEVTIYNGESETTLGELIFLGQTADPAEVAAYLDDILTENLAQDSTNAEMEVYFNGILNGELYQETDSEIENYLESLIA